MLQLIVDRMSAPHPAPTQFLATVPPFDKLPPEVLAQAGESLELSFYPAHTILYEQDRSELQELSLIVSGHVEKYFLDQDGKKRFSESFGPGDSFGAISILLNNQTAIRSVKTLTKTTLYKLPSQIFTRLCKDHTVFYEHFTGEFGKRMLDGGYASMLLKRPRIESGFQVSDLTFTQEIRQLYSPVLNTCTTETSIREAAKSMTYFRQNYVLVVSPNREPVGIITDRELRTKVVAQGMEVDQPVSKIMGSPVLEIQADAYSYEAILMMFRHKIDFLVVKEQETLLGMISLDKLLHAQAKSPFIFIQNIAHDYDTASLKEKWEDVPAIIDLLMDRGTRPEIINQVVSVIADAITHNIIRRAISRLGAPPAKFVYTALGSEGRKEQTLMTDQDNAIIYEDLEGENRSVARAYFLRLGEIVSDELNDVGFSYCKGNLMAKNPKWNHSLSHWKDNYATWIREPMSENAVIGSTFFDCRAIYGDANLLKSLRSHIFETLRKGSSAFFMALTRAALVNRPPLTLFGGIQLTDKQNIGKGLDIKRATQVISDFARIYALGHDISATNTAERLRKLTLKGILSEAELDELLQSYYFMMRLRLSHQVRQLQAGSPPDNFLLMDEVSKIERVTLKEIFRLVEKYQKRLGVVYGGTLS